MAEAMTMNKVIHGAVRRDLARFAAALDSFPEGSKDRAVRLSTAWKFFYGELDQHHHGEHEIAWPALNGGRRPDLGARRDGRRARADGRRARAGRPRLHRAGTGADPDKREICPGGRRRSGARGRGALRPRGARTGAGVPRQAQHAGDQGDGPRVRQAEPVAVRRLRRLGPERRHSAGAGSPARLHSAAGRGRPGPARPALPADGRPRLALTSSPQVSQSIPSSRRSSATCPVAFTLYCALSTRPASSMTKVERSTPVTVLPYIVFSPYAP